MNYFSIILQQNLNVLWFKPMINIDHVLIFIAKWNELTDQ